MKLFLSLCFFPILPLQYLLLRNETKPKNNLILSTTLPKEAWEDPRVQAVCKNYRNSLILITLLLALLYIPVFFLPTFSIPLTYNLIWLVAIIAVPYVPYCSYVKRMRSLKKEHWYHPEIANLQITDTKASPASYPKISTFSFLPPLLISLVPMLYPLAVPSEDVSWLTLYVICGTNTASIVLFYLCCRFLFRNKADRINADSELSVTLTRIRRYHWSRFWLFMAWFCALNSYTGLFVQNMTLVFLIAVCVLALMTLLVTLTTELTVRKAQQNLNQTAKAEILTDEDGYWPFGAFYYNPNDRSFTVNNRVGFGSTMNLAHPAAKILTVFCLLLLLACPALGIWTMAEEFTPVELVLTETSIQARHLKLEYELALDDITECSLLTELPGTSKTVGSAMDNVYKGTFSVKGIDKNCRLCLNPESAFFLLLRSNGETYIFSMGDAEDSAAKETMREIYETARQ